ncbi:hypothetical protein KSP39_PZI001846 [Platanthera zijinensis]|uniref:Uncharacterized protein n=1 Tax=Platanthera zijinensis TaxID=2320716 RepID=A0AAP0C0J9_9ASPA
MVSPSASSMSQHQRNLMSPTSFFPMQLLDTTMEKSASVAPAMSLKPPNCSGAQISTPNPQIPNQSSPIVSPSSSSIDLLQIFVPQLQMTPSRIRAVPPKTPDMSQHQRNLMSPTSFFPMQLLGTAMEKSASVAPAKSLKPPNCSGYQISTPNPQIPNLSSPIDLLQIFVPQLQMTPSRIGVVPPKLSFGGQPQFGIAMDAQGEIRRQQQQKVSQLAQPQYHIIQQQRTQQQHAILPQQLSFPQPDNISLGLQQQVSQLVQQLAQLVTVQQQQAALLLQQQQHLHQLPQLQQQHHEQQSPHVPGFTISKSLKGSQPIIPASGKNMTREIISQGICDILLGKSTTQDLVSQVYGHLNKKRLKLVYGHLNKKRLKMAHGVLHKKHLKRAHLHLHNKRLKQVRELQSQSMISDAANRLEAIQLIDFSMVKSEQLSPPVASSHVLQKLPQL